MKPFAVAIVLLTVGACAAPSPDSSALTALRHREPGVAPLPSHAAPAAVATVPVATESPYFAAQEDPSMATADDGDRTSLVLGIGATFDPESFLINAALDLPAGSQIYWGPALQLGLSESKTLVAPYLKGRFVLQGDGSDRPRIAPFLTTGIGFVYYDREGAGDEISLLINGGGGIRFDLESKVKIGSELLFNWAPAEVLGETTYVSWEIAQIIVPF